MILPDELVANLKMDIPLKLKAIFLADFAHDKQLDKSGQPYIGHPIRVLLNVIVFDDTVKAAAALHDVVEDTEVTLEQIKEYFGDRVTQLVDLLSRRKDETYKDYIRRLSVDPDAIEIKWADVIDNSSPERACPEVEGLKSRWEWTLDFLKDKRKVRV